MARTAAWGTAVAGTGGGGVGVAVGLVGCRVDEVLGGDAAKLGSGVAARPSRFAKLA